VAPAFAEALPFPVVGSTTLGALSPETDDPEMNLTLTILTSDDVTFVTGLTGSIDKEDAGVVSAAYDEALTRAHEAGLPQGEKPKLILSYAPLINNVGGDFFVNTMSAVSGGVPNFGTLTVDNTIDYAEASVLYGGEVYKDRYAFVLLCGEVNMKFHIATLSTERIFNDRGVITDVEGSLIKTVNDIPVIDYLVSLGLSKDADGGMTGVNVYPFVVDLGDGTAPIIRILFAITPEGYAVCGGDIPKGAVISVGSIDADSVVEATAAKLDEIVAGGKPGEETVLVFSCLGRYLALGYTPSREMDTIKEKLNGAGIAFSFMYSGGEICPVEGGTEGGDDEASGVANRFHNDTFIALSLS
jgi:hypothetical protein